MVELAIILGTRPEIIKMSPIIRECERLDLDYFVLHTGQHYSYKMDKLFFEQLELAEAKYNLDVGSGSHAEQTAKMLVGIEKSLWNRHSNRSNLPLFLQFLRFRSKNLFTAMSV